MSKGQYDQGIGFEVLMSILLGFDFGSDASSVSGSIVGLCAVCSKRPWLIWTGKSQNLPTNSQTYC